MKCQRQYISTIFSVILSNKNKMTRCYNVCWN